MATIQSIQETANFSADDARGAAVLCVDVTKEFGAGGMAVRALRGVDFEAARGEVTMLVGPSGCGKTTLLSIIAGLLEPTRGTVRVLGVDVTHLSGGAKAEFRKTQVGFVFQQYNLLPAFTALENIALPLLIRGTPRREALARAKELLETLEIGHRAAALPSQLSGGQQQRVAISRALVHRPGLLVCDEPTAALDAHTGRAVVQLLTTAAARSDRAVIVVTHDARILEFADRVVVMEDGRVVDTEVRRRSPCL
jgi:putative ABC transport system ATP-binding protein